MDRLERYVREHHSEFDASPLPSGSKDRFMAKAKSRISIKRIRVISMVSACVAACTILFILVGSPNVSYELKRHHTRLAEKEVQITEIAEKYYPDEKDAIIGTLRSITDDTIPLEELLPREISEKERSRILKDYYDQKYSALERLLAQYTE